MREFYERKHQALIEEQKAHIRMIENAIASIKAGDTHTTTAKSIINAGTELLRISAEINAYELSEQIDEVIR